MNNNFALLRAFNEAAAKRGEAICWDDGTPAIYVAGPDADGDYCIIDEGVFTLRRPCRLRMAPVCWVEGCPVYPGQQLYWKDQGYVFIAGNHMLHGNRICAGVSYLKDTILGEDGISGLPPAKLTWQRPVGHIPPVEQTSTPVKKVKMRAWFTGYALIFREASVTPMKDWVPVPGEDKEIEVPIFHARNEHER